MTDPLDDATQTLLRIEKRALRGLGGDSDAAVDAIIDIIWDWKQRPDSEEGEAA